MDIVDEAKAQLRVYDKISHDCTKKLIAECVSLRQKVSYLETGIAETLEQEIVDLRNQLAECQKEVLRLSEIADALLNHCEKDNGECMTCSTIVCPHKEPLHFHHDGCPACAIEAMSEKG